MVDEFLTKDLHEASFLYTTSLKFLGLISEPNSTTFYFRFKPKKKAEQLSTKFWTGEVEGDIKSYSEAIRRLKDLIFSRRGSNEFNGRRELQTAHIEKRGG